MWFPDDASAEWLNKIDVALPLGILEEIQSGEGAAPRVLEVGVWKAGWSSAILKNRPDSSLLGVDPYPNLSHVRAETLQRIENLELGNRFSLVPDFSEIQAGTKFDLIHVDGEHSEKATLRDLRNSDSFLASKGVIMVDDINHLWFPGVASALHLFMVEHNYRMFMTTGSKGYISRKDFAPEIYELMRARGPRGRLAMHEQHQDAYTQATTVLGQQVLIATYADSLADLYRKAKPRLRSLLTKG